MDMYVDYYECPICKELVDDDIEFAKHVILRHRQELRRKDKRLKTVGESIKVIIKEMLIKEIRGKVV